MKKKILALTAVLIFAASSLISCGGSIGSVNSTSDSIFEAKSTAPEEDFNYSNSYSGGWAEDYDGFSDSVAEEPTADLKSDVSVNVENQQTQTSRKIIYSSDYEIQTKNYDASVAALDALMNKYGAYFENSNTYGSADSGERRSNYTVRVPVKNYNDFISETGTLGVVTSSSQNNKDVTEAYYDTEARLESAKIREERVLEILRNASKLDDVLQLERELADIRYEIESYTGTLRKYDSLVNYSTVTISIREVSEVVVPKVTPLTFGERVSKGFYGGINNFVEGFQNFVVFLSYNFIGITIWLILVAVFVIFAVRVKKKRASTAKKLLEARENEKLNNDSDKNGDAK